MRIASTSLCALFLCTLLAVPTQAAILNGSFEDDTAFVPNQDDTESLAPGSTAMTGWTVVNAELAWIGPGNPFTVTASDGDFSLDLTGYHDSGPYGGVSQGVATTVGNVYELTFDVGALGLGQTTFVLAFADAASSAGMSTATTGSGVTWQSNTFTFTAVNSTTQIQLIGAVASADGHYIGLDNVSLTDLGGAGAVPEPASMAIWGLGSLGCAIAAYRRKRAA